jgi:hypothetical protein
VDAALQPLSVWAKEKPAEAGLILLPDCEQQRVLCYAVRPRFGGSSHMELSDDELELAMNACDSRAAEIHNPLTVERYKALAQRFREELKRKAPPKRS